MAQFFSISKTSNVLIDDGFGPDTTIDSRYNSKDSGCDTFCDVSIAFHALKNNLRTIEKVA